MHLHLSLVFYLSLRVFCVVFLYREKYAAIECAKPACSASTNPSDGVFYSMYVELITPLI